MQEEWRDKWLSGRALKITIQRDRRVFVTVAIDDFREVMDRLVRAKGFARIATITGVDIGASIEVIYHLTCKALVFSLRTLVSKEEPVLPTIIDLIPSAAFYEREVHDLLGIVFKGNPDMSPLILPDEWPIGIYPLRKEWNTERIRDKLEAP